jgi:flagellar FliJ protein
MKKFQFSLETVLNYKDQVLESLQNEHAQLMAQVREQEALVEGKREKYRRSNEEFRKKKAEGMTVLDATCYERWLRVLESEIQREQRKLDEMKKKAEKKRLEVVEAKKESSSLEKLKEKKQEEYQKAVEKNEEQEIDEFVSGARARASK